MQRQCSSARCHSTIAVYHNLLLNCCTRGSTAATVTAAAAVWQYNACFLQDLLLLLQGFEPVY
jgi:hypothetical protein